MGKEAEYSGMNAESDFSSSKVGEKDDIQKQATSGKIRVIQNRIDCLPLFDVPFRFRGRQKGSGRLAATGKLR